MNEMRLKVIVAPNSIVILLANNNITKLDMNIKEVYMSIPVETIFSVIPLLNANVYSNIYTVITPIINECMNALIIQLQNTLVLNAVLLSPI